MYKLSFINLSSDRTYYLLDFQFIFFIISIFFKSFTNLTIRIDDLSFTDTFFFIKKIIMKTSSILESNYSFLFR